MNDASTNWIAWCAGIIDGEGAIQLSYGGGRKQIYLRVSVQSTDRSIVEKLQEILGGQSVLIKARNAERRPIWIWRLFSSKAADALRTMKPWLVAKAQHSDLAIQFCEHCIKAVGSNVALSSAELEERKTFRRDLHALQIKGNNAAPFVQ